MTLSRNVQKSCLAAFILVMVGCTTSDEPMKFQDGSHGFHVYCGGMPYEEDSDCNSRAHDMCDGDYTILKDSKPPYSHSQSLWDNSTRDITVRCNKQ